MRSDKDKRYCLPKANANQRLEVGSDEQLIPLRPRMAANNLTRNPILRKEGALESATSPTHDFFKGWCGITACMQFENTPRIDSLEKSLQYTTFG